ncbi:MAG: ACT domain-containing protein [Verrucomicrobiota bacterium]|nr:ACT domain-containing protein [Verrucomicrobiota bacterium]
MIKTQFTLYVENKPGALAAITGKLAAKKINIDGISVSESTDVGLVQVVVDHADAMRKVLSGIGVPFTVQDVALLTLRNKPGALSDVVSKLAAARVNVNYVYATGCTCANDHCGCYAIISAPDLQAVEKAWKTVNNR